VSKEIPASPAKYHLTDRSNDKWEISPAMQALKRMQVNPRVKYITIFVPVDACPACQVLAGTYPKNGVPPLPVELCSHPAGCRSFYAPYLDEIYP
jgi:hypothetical protein